MISQLCIILAAATVATFLESTTVDPECVDHDIYCRVLFRSHYCKQYKVVQIQCPRTCNMCGRHEVSTTMISTTTNTPSFETTSATITPVDHSSTTYEMTTECVDIDPDCFTLLKTHYCTEDLAKKMCAATCNICVTKTTPIATTEETTIGFTIEQKTTTEPTVYETTTEVQTTEQTTDNQEITSQETTPILITITTEMLTTEEASTEHATYVYTINEETTTNTPQTTSSPISTGYTKATTVTIQTPPATLPSLKPFIPSVNNCFDKDINCKFLVDSPFCEKDPLVPRVCPVACGDCVNTTSSPTLTPEPPCVDLDPTCEDLHNISHLCEQFGLVQKQCPKSCHVCSQNTSTTPQTATCMDYDQDCPSLKPFCASRAFVKKLCPKTCNVCHTGPDVSTSASSSVSPSISSFSSYSTSLPASSTVKSPPFLGALSCRTCEDPFCDMGIEADHTCPIHAPFCMNIVGQDSHHIPTLTKRCASETQCEERWLKGSALDTRCLNLNLNSPPEEAFLCTYCCVTHECNIPAIPKTETLYRSRSR